MIDTTQLPQEIQNSLADHQPIQWIPLPVSPGEAQMLIPVHTQTTPRFMENWQVDAVLTTPATTVYRAMHDNLAVMMHGHTLSAVAASDPQTLDHALNALSEGTSRDYDLVADADRDFDSAPSRSR